MPKRKKQMVVKTISRGKLHLFFMELLEGRYGKAAKKAFAATIIDIASKP